LLVPLSLSVQMCHFLQRLEANELELEVFQNFGRGSGRNMYNFVHNFQMEKDRLKSVEHVRRLVRARAALHDRLVGRAVQRWGHSASLHVPHSPHHLVDSNNHTPGTSMLSTPQAEVEEIEHKLGLFDEKIASTVADHHTIYGDGGADFVDVEMAAWLKAKTQRETRTIL